MFLTLKNIFISQVKKTEFYFVENFHIGFKACWILNYHLGESYVTNAINLLPKWVESNV